MNAKDELLDLIKEYKVELKAAIVEDVYYDIDEKNRRKFILYPGYSKDELTEFLKKLNFKYHEGFGSQVLGGTLWFVGGTWADRGEYDGSEWWEYHVRPKLPKKLQQRTIDNT